MRIPLQKDEERASRFLAGLAAVALAFVTLGTFVVAPAVLEARGIEVRLPHVDETGPRMAAVPTD